jgi:uncharacterized protein (DUF2267 family)
MLVRGVYYESWRPSRNPTGERSVDEFLQHVFLQHVAREPQDMRPVDVQDASRCVFRLLDRHVAAGEIEDVKPMLPEHIRRLWPQEPPPRATA